LNGENESSDFLRKILKELKGRWTFKRKKKNKVRINTSHPKGD
jgi:hypothetical protein